MNNRLYNIAIVIGMPRAGTTWLYENIKHHPNVHVSDRKEINHYLTNTSQEDYLSNFPDHSSGLMIDISPLYFFSLSALNEINIHHNKVILIRRQHNEWLDSLHSQIKKYGGDLERMIRTGIYTFNLGFNKTLDINLSEFDQNKHIDKIKEIFGNKLLLIEFTRIENEPLKVLRDIEQFLTIDPFFDEETIETSKINSSQESISPLYAWLFRTGILHHITPIVIKLLPSKLIHWLRHLLVYGKR